MFKYRHQNNLKSYEKFQSLKYLAQKLSVPWPFVFLNQNGCHLLNFAATNLSFWLKVNWIQAFNCCFMTLSLRQTVFEISSKTRYPPYYVPPTTYENNFWKLFSYIVGGTQQGGYHVLDDTSKTVCLRLKVIKQQLKAYIQLTLSQKEKFVAAKLSKWRPF